MAVKRTPHVALTLRGNQVTRGIRVRDYIVPFEPQWGLARDNDTLLAVTPETELQRVFVAVTEHGVAIVASTQEAERELVLAQEYETGSGAKRWPGFQVEMGEEVRVLSNASTSGGSGYETWTLVSAPLGWAQNIAAQFVNERDVNSQTIHYKVGEEEGDVSDSTMAAALRRAGLI